MYEQGYQLCESVVFVLSWILVCFDIYFVGSIHIGTYYVVLFFNLDYLVVVVIF